MGKVLTTKGAGPHLRLNQGEQWSGAYSVVWVEHAAPRSCSSCWLTALGAALATSLRASIIDFSKVLNECYTLTPQGIVAQIRAFENELRQALSEGNLMDLMPEIDRRIGKWVRAVKKDGRNSQYLATKDMLWSVVRLYKPRSKSGETGNLKDELEAIITKDRKGIVEGMPSDSKAPGIGENIVAPETTNTPAQEGRFAAPRTQLAPPTKGTADEERSHEQKKREKEEAAERKKMEKELERNKEVAEKKEAALKEAAAKKEAAQRKEAAAKKEAAQKEAAERKETARKEAARKEAARKEAAEKKETAKKEAAEQKKHAAEKRKLAAQKEAVQKEAAQKEEQADKKKAAAENKSKAAERMEEMEAQPYFNAKSKARPKPKGQPAAILQPSSSKRKREESPTDVIVVRPAPAQRQRERAASPVSVSSSAAPEEDVTDAPGNEDNEWKPRKRVKEGSDGEDEKHQRRRAAKGKQREESQDEDMPEEGHSSDIEELVPRESKRRRLRQNQESEADAAPLSKAKAKVVAKQSKGRKRGKKSTKPTRPPIVLTGDSVDERVEQLIQYGRPEKCINCIDLNEECAPLKPQTTYYTISNDGLYGCSCVTCRRLKRRCCWYGLPKHLGHDTKFTISDKVADTNDDDIKRLEAIILEMSNKAVSLQEKVDALESTLVSRDKEILDMVEEHNDITAAALGKMTRKLDAGKEECLGRVRSLEDDVRRLNMEAVSPSDLKMIKKKADTALNGATTANVVSESLISQVDTLKAKYDALAAEQTKISAESEKIAATLAALLKQENAPTQAPTPLGPPSDDSDMDTGSDRSPGPPPSQALPPTSLASLNPQASALSAPSLPPVSVSPSSPPPTVIAPPNHQPPTPSPLPPAAIMSVDPISAPAEPTSPARPGCPTPGPLNPTAPPIRPRHPSSAPIQEDDEVDFDGED
ncbi:hypothetical protein D9613_004502 [Agrocybe pediades]|uniref:Uncharacterized protein n=1 Tax=Agrocybe pediades TaxID=84607 RepID=A0A8H4QJN1_9AGAR|nr:hypothetical protein D9613_004502 [Agrocybe pediades]